MVYKSCPGKYLTIKYIFVCIICQNNYWEKRKEIVLWCFSEVKQAKNTTIQLYGFTRYLPIFIIYYFLIYSQASLECPRSSFKNNILQQKKKSIKRLIWSAQILLAQFVAWQPQCVCAVWCPEALTNL